MGELVTKLIPDFKIGEIQVDEDIDNYWASLDRQDRKWSVAEEKNNRALCGGLRVLTDPQFKQLCETPITTGHTLVGTHTYDILANPHYLDDF
jgi:hypothetical protein